MGIRGKFFAVIAIIGVVLGGATYAILERSHNSLIEQEAVRVAEIVSTQVVSDRAVYTQELVGKLMKDGVGASENSGENKGYIPLPAQFVRNVSKRVAQQAKGLYSYSLVSLWNLNPEQGLNDEFDRWAWKQLEQQEQAFATGPAVATGYAWKPVYRFETKNGKSKLLYMMADPAAAAACVSCHNNYEKQADVMALRNGRGIAPGKTFTLNGLMGALRVEVPIDQVAALAAEGRDRTLGALAAIFVIGFALLLWLIHLAIIKPVEWSVLKVEGFTSKIDAVVLCNKDLVQAADEQATACRGAQNVLDAGDIVATTRSLASLASVANDNAMRAEDSAVYCNDLNESFDDLKTKLQEIVQGGKKASSLFGVGKDGRAE